MTLGARPERGEAMVAGDVVNTAARLQQAAPAGGILVGAETYARTRDAITYEPAEPVAAKGKSSRSRRARPARRRAGRRARALAVAARRPRERAATRCARSGAGDGERDAPPRHVLGDPRHRQDAALASSSRGTSVSRRARVRGPVAALPREQRIRRVRLAAEAALPGSSRATPSTSAGEARPTVEDVLGAESTPTRRPPSRDPARARPGAVGGRPRDALLLGALLHRGGRAPSDRRCSCSRTCTGPTRACSISSSCSARGCASSRSCCSSSRGPSCSTRGRVGRRASGVHRAPAQPLGEDEARELACSCSAGAGARSPSGAPRFRGDRGGEPALHRAAGRGRVGAVRRAAARCRRRSAASSPRGWTRCRPSERAVLLDAAVRARCSGGGRWSCTDDRRRALATCSARSSGAT